MFHHGWPTIQLIKRSTRVWTDQQGLQSYEAKDKMRWAEVQHLLGGEEATGCDDLAGE